jgi:hypothetical protein
MTPRRIAGLALLVWEIWWVYVYLSAPKPDERMVTVLAFFMAAVLPAAIILLAVAIFVVRRFGAAHRRR